MIISSLVQLVHYYGSEKRISELPIEKIESIQAIIDGSPRSWRNGFPFNSLNKLENGIGYIVKSKELNYEIYQEDESSVPQDFVVQNSSFIASYRGPKVDLSDNRNHLNGKIKFIISIENDTVKYWSSNSTNNTLNFLENNSVYLAFKENNIESFNFWNRSTPYNLEVEIAENGEFYLNWDNIEVQNLQDYSVQYSEFDPDITFNPIVEISSNQEVVNDNISFSQFGKTASFNNDGSIFATICIERSTNLFVARAYQANEFGDWNQLGPDIQIGYYGKISLNGMGNRLAISDPYSDESGFVSNGFVSIYEWDGFSWNQLGSKIEGKTDGDRSGELLCINSAGDLVFLGSSANQGYVRAYQWNGSSWIQIGEDIIHESLLFGPSPPDYYVPMSLSSNSSGDKIAIGFPNIRSGIVRVYEWTESTWQKIGVDISGNRTGEMFGKSVSLNSVGDILAIGAPKAYSLAESLTTSAISNFGLVKVFNWNGNSWTQMGDSIYGQTKNEYMGESLSLSSTGDRLSIGSPQKDRVYTYAWTGSFWSILFYPLEGGRYFGVEVKFNSEGNKLLIGAPFDDKGKVHIYGFSNTSSVDSLNSKWTDWTTLSLYDINNEPPTTPHLWLNTFSNLTDKKRVVFNLKNFTRYRFRVANVVNGMVGDFSDYIESFSTPSFENEIVASFDGINNEKNAQVICSNIARSLKKGNEPLEVSTSFGHFLHEGSSNIINYAPNEGNYSIVEPYLTNYTTRGKQTSLKIFPKSCLVPLHHDKRSKVNSFKVAYLDFWVYLEPTLNSTYSFRIISSEGENIWYEKNTSESKLIFRTSGAKIEVDIDPLLTEKWYHICIADCPNIEAYEVKNARSRVANGIYFFVDYLNGRKRYKKHATNNFIYWDGSKWVITADEKVLYVNYSINHTVSSKDPPTGEDPDPYPVGTSSTFYKWKKYEGLTPTPEVSRLNFDYQNSFDQRVFVFINGKNILDQDGLPPKARLNNYFGYRAGTGPALIGSSVYRDVIRRITDLTSSNNNFWGNDLFYLDYITPLPVYLAGAGTRKTQNLFLNKHVSGEYLKYSWNDWKNAKQLNASTDYYYDWLPKNEVYPDYSSYTEYTDYRRIHYNDPRFDGAGEIPYLIYGLRPLSMASSPQLPLRKDWWTKEFPPPGPAHYEEPMILVFDTDIVSPYAPIEDENGDPISVKSDKIIELTLKGQVDVAVDWGDGSFDRYTTPGHKKHEYEHHGEYTVKIYGSMTEFGSSNTMVPRSDYSYKLIKCISFGNLGITSLENAFYECNNLIEVPNQLPNSFITSLSGAFYNCSNFEDSQNNLRFWETKNVTSMYRTFYGCSLFSGNSIKNWDTSSVTNFSLMFYNCTLFNANIGDWDVSSGTSFSGMFNTCSAFNQDLSNWNISNATNLSGMFSSCVSFNKNLGKWDTSSVTTTWRMFSGCSLFNDGNQYADEEEKAVGIKDWDISKITDMREMFQNCYNFNQDISNWKFGSSLLRIDNLLRNCTSFSVSNTNKLIYSLFTARNEIDVLSNLELRPASSEMQFYLDQTNFLNSNPSNDESLILFYSFEPEDINLDNIPTAPKYLSIGDGFLPFQHIGKKFIFKTTGKTQIERSGQTGTFVYGDGVYRIDSSLEVAAVHSGILKANETGLIEATILPKQYSFVGSTKNGISSSGWYAGEYAFSLRSLDTLRQYELNYQLENEISIYINPVSAPQEINIQIDWGDGTIESHTSSGYKMHSYSDIKNRTVKITGSMPNGFKQDFKSAIRLYRCDSFGNLGITSLEESFKNCYRLKTVPRLLPSSVTNLNKTFVGCKSLDSDLSDWDFSNIVSMNDFMRNVTLSSDNYDKLLSSLSLNKSSYSSSINTCFGHSRSSSSSAKQDLTSYGWTIVDGGSLESLNQYDTESSLILVFDTTKATASDYDHEDIRLDSPTAQEIQERQTWAELGVAIFLPLSSDSITVDWGDGTILSYTGGVNAPSNWQECMDKLIVHTYATEGVYEVKITGNLSHLIFDDLNFIRRNSTTRTRLRMNMFRKKLVGVKSFGSVGLKEFDKKLNIYGTMESSSKGVFEECPNLIEIPTNLPDSIISMKNLFKNCLSVLDWSNLENWNVSNITSAEEAFYNSSISNVNINLWNTKNLINMNGMFKNSLSFNGEISNWNVSNVTNMKSIFESDNPNSAHQFNKNLEFWDVSRNENLTNSFLNCDFDQNVENWDITNLKTAENFSTNMSATNYSKLLVGWSEKALPGSKVKLGVDSYYEAYASPYRSILVDSQSLNAKEWQIIDLGLSDS